jgi:hypothetical protein
MNNYSPLSLFFRACLIGGLFCLCFYLSGCGGHSESESEDLDSQESTQSTPKTTQPVNCVNNPACR